MQDCMMGDSQYVAAGAGTPERLRILAAILNIQSSQ
jgi:hypothetical protein